jgi:hypothetical protein
VEALENVSFSISTPHPSSVVSLNSFERESKEVREAAADPSEKAKKEGNRRQD